jgi:DNA-binding Lrp family transcriptional regulator
MKRKIHIYFHDERIPLMMNNPVLDEVDLRILQYLLEDSTRSHKEIGQLLHLTGQAVGARIRKLQDIGVIEGYTLRWNPDKIGQPVHAFITVFIKSSTAHQSFQSFVKRKEKCCRKAPCKRQTISESLAMIKNGRTAKQRYPLGPHPVNKP